MSTKNHPVQDPRHDDPIVAEVMVDAEVVEVEVVVAAAVAVVVVMNEATIAVVVEAVEVIKVHEVVAAVEVNKEVANFVKDDSGSNDKHCNDSQQHSASPLPPFFFLQIHSLSE